MNKRSEAESAFERALEMIQARVCVSAARKSASLALAYSGGLDSTVLLHLLARYTQPRSVQVHAFHVHHGLSPHANAWLQHCRSEALRLGASFDAVQLHLDPESIRTHGIEHAARVGRYKALAAMCSRKSVGLLLAAHHQDDQAETLMLQLMRGAGLPGLCGMAFVQEDHALLGTEIILGRPLLECSRAALEEYASLHRLTYVEDESNQDISYRRNALRHAVFPLLQVHFPGFAACIARSASHVQTAQHLLDELAESDLKHCRNAFHDTALQLHRLAGLSPQRCNNVLRYWLHGMSMPAPSTARLEELRQQMLEARHDRQPLLELENFALSRAGDCLILHPKLGHPPKEELALQWRGEAAIAIPQWRGTLQFDHVVSGGIAEHRLLAAPIAIRARRGQERLKVAANRPTRSLKNLYQEAAVPSWQREWLPLAYLDRQLIFVAGLGMDVRCQTTKAGIALNWRCDWQSTP